MKLYHLLELRKKTGRNQTVTAELMGTSQTLYQRWESGTTEPSWEKAITLALYFDVSLDYLAGLTDNPKRN